MIGFKRFNIVLALLLTSALTASAANSNVGTSGAQFLKIGAGARSTSMGGAFVGLADDVNAVYYNPAGLGFIERPELTAMHTQYLQGIDYEFGAFVYPTEYGALALSAATLKVEDQQKRNSDESLVGEFETLDAAYALSYAKSLNDRLSLGLTARFVDQEIDIHSASTWSGDVGVLYRFGRRFSMGLAARHFGQEVEFQNESDPLPFTIDLGFGLRLLDERLKFSADVRNPRDNDIQFGLGGEWNQPLFREIRIAGRAGFNTEGTDADGASGLSVGGGLGFRQFSLDFAWVPFGDLGDTFRYAAMVRF